MSTTKNNRGGGYLVAGPVILDLRRDRAKIFLRGVVLWLSHKEYAMSSQLLLADRLAAALRSHFDQGHLGKREILIDMGKFNLFSRHYPVKFVLPDKDVHRSIEEPMSQDLFANAPIECRLKMAPGELKVIFAQILNGLLHRMSFQFSLPVLDADLLRHMQVESIDSHEALKAQLVSLNVSFHSGNGVEIQYSRDAAQFDLLRG